MVWKILNAFGLWLFHYNIRSIKINQDYFKNIAYHIM